MVKTN